MAMIALITAITGLVFSASAENYTTTMLLPDMLFWSTPMLQTFVAVSTVSSSTTYYILNCGPNDTYFWPGPNGCINNNSYTFSKVPSAVTQYVLQDVNFGEEPYPNTAPVATWLEVFNQTVTIECGAGGSGGASCTTTSLWNDEDADDKSIIHPTIWTQTTTLVESSLYPIIFTTAVAAAMPSNSIAPSTTTANPTSSSSRPPTSTPASLSAGSKAGIGISVPIGVFALAGLALLLYRHRKHKERSRPCQMENLVPAGGYGGEFEEGKGNSPENSGAGGVYEMAGGRSPAHSIELEA